MNTYKRHRFPPDIISYAVWLYYRFNLSYRDVEDLLAERGIIVTRESIRIRGQNPFLLSSVTTHTRSAISREDSKVRSELEEVLGARVFDVKGSDLVFSFETLARLP